jgi:hypothetical protein
MSLERTRINLKKNLPFTHKRAFFVRLQDDVSRHLGLNLRVYVAIKRRHPFAENGDVFLKHAGDFNLGARNGGRRCRVAATHSQKHGCRQKNQNESSCRSERGLRISGENSLEPHPGHPHDVA